MTLQYINEQGIHYNDLRESLYWNKYHYRAKLILPHGARWKSSYTLAQYLARIDRYWLSRRSQEFVTANPDIYERYHAWRVNALHAGADVTARAYSGETFLYSNDLQLLTELSQVHDSLRISRAVVVNRVSGVKQFRYKPAHNFRIYLRSMYISNEQFDKFVDWLSERKDKFTMSPAFKRSAYGNESRYNSYRRYLSSSYFIDYDVESYESFLQIMWNEYLGKHYRLEQHQRGTLCDANGNIINTEQCEA